MMNFTKISLLMITLCSAVVVCGQVKTPDSSMKVSTVVIDAGHGGDDPGCVRSKFKEKDVTLAVALKLGRMIEDNFKDVKVLYTRKTDVAVKLAERGNIANRAGADLFISIHVDAVDNNGNASGNSSYVMGIDKENENLDVAMRENDVIMLEEDYEKRYQGYIPGSEESFIIFSLMQYAYQQQSMTFAELIQKQYRKNTGLPDRGARQARYLVLWNTAMPSVLTETGFMSNAKDRAFLTSDEGQKKVAVSIFNAFSEYKSLTEGRSGALVLSDDAVDNSAQERARSSSAAAERPTASADNAKSTAVSDSKAAASGGVKYYVQLCTLSKKPDPKSAAFKSFAGKVVVKTTPNGSYRCLVGGTTKYSEAVKLQAAAGKEFKGAFIAAFDGDEFISLDEARKRQQ